MRRITRLSGGPALALLMTVAGCGSSQSSDSVPASSASGSAPEASAVDPCALVTNGEADEALGAPSTADRPSEANMPPRLVTCRYTAPRGAAVEVLTVMVRTGYSDTEAKTGFQGIRDVGPTEAVAGLGDDAFWLADQLHVLSGRRSLVVSGDVDRETARRFAQQAIERMK